MASAVLFTHVRSIAEGTSGQVFRLDKMEPDEAAAACIPRFAASCVAAGCVTLFMNGIPTIFLDVSHVMRGEDNEVRLCSSAADERRYAGYEFP